MWKGSALHDNCRVMYAPETNGKKGSRGRRMRSGIFPIKRETATYDEAMLAAFDERIADEKFPWRWRTFSLMFAKQVRMQAF